MRRSNSRMAWTAAGSPGSRSIRRFTAGWYLGLAAVLALSVALSLSLSLALAPASVRADPQPSEKELRAKIDKLTTKAEIWTERYNGKKLQLRKARKAAAQARKRAARLDRRLQRMSDVVGGLAASRYKNGGIGGAMEMFTATSPGNLMDSATLLSHLSRQRVVRLREVQAAAERADRAERRRRMAATRVERITANLQQKKKRIEKLVSEAEQRLAELQPQSQTGPSRVNVGNVGSGKAAQAVEVALDQQGDPYVWGAAGPDSFDCSGLVTYAFGKQGIQLPHYTGKLWESGTHVSRSELKPGDLVFTAPHHVGIYVGNGKMVHAPNSGTVVQVEEVYDYYGGVRIT